MLIGHQLTTLKTEKGKKEILLPIDSHALLVIGFVLLWAF
jgi:hypothetical protein